MEQRVLQVIPIKDLAKLIVGYTKILKLEEIPWEQVAVTEQQQHGTQAWNGYRMFTLFRQPIRECTIVGEITSHHYPNSANEWINLRVSYKHLARMQDAAKRYMDGFLKPYRAKFGPYAANDTYFMTSSDTEEDEVDDLNEGDKGVMRLSFSKDKNKYIARDEDGKRIVNFSALMAETRCFADFHVHIIFTPFIMCDLLDYSLSHVVREIRILRRSEELIEYDLQQV